MANKREITIVITRWEAQALVWAHESLLDANGGHPDWRAFDRAVNKIEARMIEKVRQETLQSSGA